MSGPAIFTFLDLVTPTRGADTSGFLWLIVIVVLYFLPSIRAQSKHHRNVGAIFVVNLFFGWTLLGWVIALAMAAGSPQLLSEESKPHNPSFFDGFREGLRDDDLADGMRRCPTCNAEVPTAREKCWKCGSSLQTAIPASASSLPKNSGTVEQLERLAALRDRGALTDDEFNAQKAKLLA